MWREVEAARSVNQLPLGDGEVREDREAGEVDLGGPEPELSRERTETEPELS